MQLEDRVAIVTGASRGVGRAIALAMAREGCHIVLAAKTVEPHPKLPGTIHTVAREVEALGRRALAVQTDVRFPEQIASMVARAAEVFGRIDILVNNAGAAWWFPLDETPLKRFDLVMDVNCKGPFFASQEVLPHMKRRNWGHIINLSPPIRSSMAAGKIAYAISKFGMTLLTHGLAQEAAAWNIAVNSLWPVTLVESLATINLGLGAPENWRKADILGDAAAAIAAREPRERTGQALTDEEVLRQAGVGSFEKYACVPGTTPQVIPW